MERCVSPQVLGGGILALGIGVCVVLGGLVVVGGDCGGRGVPEGVRLMIMLD